MPFMTRIAADLIQAGLDVGYVPGWERRGSSSFAPVGVIDHWTAGPRGTSSSPSLGVVVNGRPGLPGPLCNVYLARNGQCVIVAAGRANHAGAGSWRGATGNSSMYGIEAESAGNNDWTAAQREVYPRLVAALLRGLGRGAEWTCGHNEWAPSRKIDIRDWPMSLMRSQVAAILAGGPAPLPVPAPAPQPEEYVMASRDEVRSDLTQIVRAELSAQLGATSRPRGFRLKGTHLFWADFGTFIRPWSAGMQSVHPIEAADVEVTDPVWRLPRVGGYGDETYALPDQPHVWAGDTVDGKFVRRWLDLDAYNAAGRPVIHRLDPSHPFWSLPVVGEPPA